PPPRLLQLLHLPRIRTDIPELFSSTLSQPTDLCFQRRIPPTPSDPHHPRLVPLHHVPRPHLSQSARSPDHHVDPVLPIPHSRTTSTLQALHPRILLRIPLSLPMRQSFSCSPSHYRQTFLRLHLFQPLHIQQTQ